ncbi:MAG: hypothetical protein ACRC4M_01160 [Mycoplasma sp.]
MEIRIRLDEWYEMIGENEKDFSFQEKINFIDDFLNKIEINKKEIFETPEEILKITQEQSIKKILTKNKSIVKNIDSTLIEENSFIEGLIITLCKKSNLMKISFNLFESVELSKILKNKTSKERDKIIKNIFDNTKLFSWFGKNITKEEWDKNKEQIKNIKEEILMFNSWGKLIILK